MNQLCISMNLCQCISNQKLQMNCKLWIKCVSTKRVSKFEHKVNVYQMKKTSSKFEWEAPSPKLKVWSSNLNHKIRFTKIKFVYTNYNKSKHPHLIHQYHQQKRNYPLCSICYQTNNMLWINNQIDHYWAIMKMVENIPKSSVDIQDSNC